MDSISLILGVTLACIAITLALAYMLNIYNNWQKIQAAILESLVDRQGLVVGVLAMLIYSFVFLVLGGQGGRIHYFYGRWIFNITLEDLVMGILSVILVGIAMAMFIHTIHKMGAPKAGKGGVGIAGTLLAVLASFCP